MSLVTILDHSNRLPVRASAGAASIHDRRRTEHFHLLFDSTPDGIVLLDPYNTEISWPIVECNRAFCQMNGFPREQLIGQSIDIVHPEPDPSGLREGYLERMQLEGSISVEAVHRHKSGALFTIEASTTFIEIDRKTYVIGVDRDITAKKQAEQAADQRIHDLELLRRASLALTEKLDFPSVLNVLLKTALDLSPDAVNTHVFLYDRGELTFAAAADRQGPLDRPVAQPRPAGLTATVARQGQVIFVQNLQTDPRFRAPERYGAILGLPLKVRERIVGVMSVAFAESYTLAEHEMHMLHLLADHAAIAIQNAALYREQERINHNLEKAVESASTEMRQMLEHLQAIFRYSPNAILMMTPEGTMRTANPAFLELFDTTMDEIAGKSPVQFVAAPYKAHILMAAQQVRETRQPLQFEIAFQIDGDDWRDIAIALAPIQEGDDLLGMVCNLWDITAFKEIERLKDAILAVAAHELRTPLTSVLGFSEILLTRNLDEAASQRYLTFINSQALHLKQLIDDLLDVSRLQDGRGIQMKAEPVDMSRLVAGVVAPLNDQFPGYDITIGDIPPTLICGDPARLEQVITNLLSNAIKYSPDGGPIAISGQVAGGCFQLAVRDQGIGMTADQQKHIFERFFRVDTTNSAPSGVGLGLTICDMIVSAHGGSIAVESAPGQGSTFTVSLPVSPAA